MVRWQEVLQVILMAATPMLERGTPVVAWRYGFSAQLTLVLFVIGNMLPVIPVMLLIRPISRALDHLPFFHRLFEWLFTKCRRNQLKINKYGFWGLVLFAAIPSPLTGTWSGAVVAFLMGIRKRTAFVALLLGSLVAGAILVSLTYGLAHLLGF